MSLRKRAFVTTMVVLVGAIVVCLIISQTILMRRFDGFEERETSQDVARAAAALFSDLSAVSAVSGQELSASTAVVDENATYLRMSMDQTTFATLDLDFILVVAPDQPLRVYGFDPVQGTVLTVPADLESHLTQGSPVMQAPEGQLGVTGILMLSGGPMLLSTYPTEVSLDGTSLNGTVILARYLDDAEVERLCEVADLAIALYPIDDPEVPDGARMAQQSADGSVPTYVHASNSHAVAGYGVLNDLYGNPALVIKVELPRDIHQQGLFTLLYLVCAIVPVAVVAGLAGSYFAQRPVMVRLLRLSNGVVRVRTTEDLSQRVDVTGDDEITTLEMSINSMLASLEKSQKELRESEAQNKALVKGIPDFMFRVGMDGTLLEGRSAKGGNILEPYRRIQQGKMLYHPLKQYGDLTREVITRGLDHMDRAIQTGEAQIFEFQLPVDGRDFFYEVRMMASAKENELLCVVFDVTQRHVEAEKKETLIKEIHHRVKNNLQVIASLLYLQSTRLDDVKTMHIFEESSNRVKSISLIHEKLYKERLHGHPQGAEVDFGDYVRDLTDALFASYGVDRKTIRLVLDTSSAFLSLDSAVPCGLIVNELISNSLKYAFPDGRAGEIRIGVYGDVDGKTTLIVGDNGVGLPPDTDLERSSSLGLRLVKMLGQQLGAEIRTNRNKGTEFRFKFTDCKKKEEPPGTSQPRQTAGAEVGGG